MYESLIKYLYKARSLTSYYSRNLSFFSSLVMNDPLGFALGRSRSYVRMVAAPGTKELVFEVLVANGFDGLIDTNVSLLRSGVKEGLDEFIDLREKGDSGAVALSFANVKRTASYTIERLPGMRKFDPLLVNYEDGKAKTQGEEEYTVYRVRVPLESGEIGVDFMMNLYAFDPNFTQPSNTHNVIVRQITSGDNYVLQRDLVNNYASVAKKLHHIVDGKTFSDSLYDQAIRYINVARPYNEYRGIFYPAPPELGDATFDPNKVHRKAIMQAFVNDKGYATKDAVQGTTATGQDSAADVQPVVVDPTSSAQYTLKVKNAGDIALGFAKAYVDGKELPISWAKVEKNGKLTAIDLSKLPTSLDEAFAPQDTLYLGVEEKDVSKLSGETTKRVKLTFAGGVNIEDTVKLTTYQEQHLSKVTKSGDTPVWDFYRNDSDTKVGTVDLTHITAEVDKLSKAVPDVETITQLVNKVENYIKQLNDAAGKPTLTEEDKQRELNKFATHLKTVRGFEEQLGEIKANLIVSIEHNAKNDTYTLKRADGTMVPGVIDATGIRGAEPNAAGGVTITDAQGKRTVIGNTAYTFREVGQKGQPGYKVVLQETVPGGIPRDVATFNAYDGYIIKVDQHANSDVILTRLDGQKFTISLSEIRGKIDHAKNTGMTQDELNEIAGELQRVSGEVDQYAANTNQSFETVHKNIDTLRSDLDKLNMRADKVEQKVLTKIATDPQQPGVYDFTYKDGSTMRVIARGAGRIELVEGSKRGNLLRVTDALGRTQEVDIRDLTVDTVDGNTEHVRITLPDGSTLEFSTRDDKLVDVKVQENGDYVFVSSTGKRWTMSLTALYKQLDELNAQVQRNIEQLRSQGAQQDAAQRALEKALHEQRRQLDTQLALLAALVRTTEHHEDVLTAMQARLDRMDATLRTQTEQLAAEKLRLDGVDTVLRDINTQLDEINVQLRVIATRLDAVDVRVKQHTADIQGLVTDGIVDGNALQCSGTMLLSMLPLLLAVPAAAAVYNAALPQLGKTQASQASVTTLGVLGLISMIAGGVSYQQSCRSAA